MKQEKEKEKEKDFLDDLLDRAITVPGPGSRTYVLRAPTANAIRDIDSHQNMPEEERADADLWASRLFAKCLLHTVNADASGIRERSEDEWIQVLYAAERAPDLGLAELTAAAQRLFGFNVSITPAADVVDHADTVDEGLGEIPT